jgi:glycerophosphoryl diester phosphodiesterase
MLPPRRTERNSLAIAHRGASCMAPENTLLAFQLALEAGVDAIETDARLTADGEIVLLHDSELARTTDGSGLVSSQSLDAVRSLDAGYWYAARGLGGHAFRGLGLRVPTLAELFALLDRLAPQVSVHLELKNSPGDPDFDPSERLAEAVVAWLQRNHGVGRTVVSAFNPAAIESVKRLEPRLRTGYLVGAGRDLDAELAYVIAHGHDALHPRHDLLDADTAASLRVLAAAREAGVDVNVWTVNEPARMRELAALGVDGLMSDDPQRLCATLDAVRTGAS